MKNLFGALSNSGRLRMIRILLQGPLNVSEISRILDLSQSNVSHSLRKLLDAGLVVRKGKGSWAYYSIRRDDTVARMILDAVTRGEKRIENFDRDMSELRFCYERRREEARKFFDRVASELDEVSYLMPDPAGYIASVISGFTSGSRVVDAGCGGGEILQKLLHAGMAVIGVDQSNRMLSRAKRKIDDNREGDLFELRLGSAEHLPVADSSVDGVVAHMLLHHMSDPSEFFPEAARVCRTGGRCTVVELNPHDDYDMKRIQGDLWPGLEKVDVREWMRSSGFKDMEEKTAGDGRIFILSGVYGRKEDNG